MTVTSVSQAATAAEHSTPTRVSGGYALMDALRRHGVETIFGYPGGAILPIYDEPGQAKGPTAVALGSFDGLHPGQGLRHTY